MARRFLPRYKKIFPRLIQGQSITSKSAGKSRVLTFLWSSLKRMCMAIGFSVLLLSVYGGYAAYKVSKHTGEPMPEKFVLYLDLKQDPQELPVASGFGGVFGEVPLSLREIVAALDRARYDDRVKGLFLRLNASNLSLAHVQELRGAIKRFKDSGRFTKIYAQSYGDMNGGFGGYYLASAFDEIWMQPMGIVSITGLSFKAPYLRAVLDKIGIEPNFYQRKDYKTAYESFTNTDMSPASREMMGQLLGDIRTELVREIPQERGIKAADFYDMVDKGLFTAKESLEEKLITHLDYADVLVANIKENVTGDREYEERVFVNLGYYLYQPLKDVVKPDPKDKPIVALVYAVGAIMPSADDQSSVNLGEGIAAADEIAPAILDAADNEDVNAIVLRIDSPGGSPSASESILRAVDRAKQKGKMVIVSMGPTAASGGYWIAAYADRIFVLPSTLTGSIGVLGGKVSGAELFNKLGVKWEGISWGKNAGLWDFTQTYSDAEAERINAMLDEVYEGFIGRVAKGRKMKPEDVEKIAQGRVWTGTRAVEIGLADELGGLTEALNYIAKQLGKTDKRDLNVVILPEPETPLEKILELLGSSGTISQNMKINAAINKAVAPLMHDVRIMQYPELYTIYEPAALTP